MEHTNWDEQLDYLMNTRDLFYNDDYLEFLVRSVWRINAPVRMIDYGCGYGYMGLKLLPLLPPGSTYTGVDLSEKLLDTARQLYERLPYEAEFIHGDVNEITLERSYDIAMCHALLLHVPDPELTLSRMIASVADGGRIICFEPHWMAHSSNMNLLGVDQSSIVPLGILQRLFERDARGSGRDGNIGVKVPALLSRLGVRNIECRVSDKVVLIDPNMEEAKRASLYRSLKVDGVGVHPGHRGPFVERLIARGLTSSEADRQYAAEAELADRLTVDSYFASSAGMKITSGTVG